MTLFLLSMQAFTKSEKEHALKFKFFHQYQNAYILKFERHIKVYICNVVCNQFVTKETIYLYN